VLPLLPYGRRKDSSVPAHIIAADAVLGQSPASAATLQQAPAVDSEGRPCRHLGGVCVCVRVCVCVCACVRACVRVLWQVDPEGGRNPMRRCMHVNLIKSSNLGHEREFLFAPYSVFTVRRSLYMCI
jgi:hypothetical protein